MRERYGFREGMVLPLSEDLLAAGRWPSRSTRRLGRDDQEYVVETLRSALA